MKIAIDIDDTITNSYALITRKLEEHYNISVKKIKKNRMSYDDINKNKINFPNYKTFVKNNFESFMYKVSTKKNALKIINKLYKEGYEILIVTARNKGEYKNPYEYTKNYLKKKKLLYTKLYTEIKNKGLFCKENNIDLLIDDSIMQCNLASKYNVKSYLFNTLFNKTDKIHKRVYNWNEIYQLLSQK